MARVLVTGGAGYVGSVCASELIRRGQHVLVIDNLSTGHIEAIPAEAEFYEFDIGDQRKLDRLLKSKKVDAVFHFAAKALIPESVTDPAAFYRCNLQSGFAMAESLRQAGIHKFVFSSTAAVYGDPTSVPIPEDHPKNPVNSYGETKLAFENLLRWYGRAYEWNVVAFRYFNACGATETHGELHKPETHIIPLLLEAACGLRPHFSVYGTDYDTPDGSCLRDYVHVLDIADAHLRALEHMVPGFQVYNIGTGTSHSVFEICRAVESVTGREISIHKCERRSGDPAILCASPERIKKHLGWKPLYSDLRYIVESAWEWQQKRLRLAPHLEHLGASSR